MKANPIRIALIAMTLAFATADTANAAGCLKGAVVGGGAGHYAGHHPAFGAVGGAWSTGTLRSSTLNSKLCNVRQHRRNKTSSA